MESDSYISTLAKRKHGLVHDLLTGRVRENVGAK